MNFRRCMFTDGQKYSRFIKDVVNPEKDTFDVQFLRPSFEPYPQMTPFTNIRFALPEEHIDPYHKHLLRQQPAFEGAYADYIQALKAALRNSLVYHINPDKKYLFLHSSGLDSRFISGTMAELRRQGLHKFENVHFRCHSPENEAFLFIMKLEGWPPEQYSTWDHNEDCYGIGTPDVCVNGWCPYSNQMNFWQDITPDPKEWIVITGEGGELFKYIGKHKESPYAYSENYHLNMLIEHNPENGEWENQLRGQFADYFMPLWSYEYLDVSNKVLPGWINRVPANGWDNIRVDLVRSVGLPVDFFIRNDYEKTWKVPEARQEEMIRQFCEGEFFRRYNALLPRNIDFFRDIFSGWEAKLWGFAVTVYDKVYKRVTT